MPSDTPAPPTATDAAGPAAPRRSDLVLSVALPLAIILVGVAASLGPAGAVGAVIDLCRAAIE